MSKISLFSPHFVEHEVNGQSVRFYPISVLCLGRMRSVIAKLASAMSTVLAGDKREAGHIVENFEAPDGSRGEKFTQSPINPDLASMRAKQRADAVESAITTLLEPKNAASLCELLMVSMRDAGFPRSPSNTDIDKFHAEVDVHTLIQMIVGCAKANAKVFGGGTLDLGKLVEDRVRAALSPTATTDGENSSEPSSGS